VQSPKQCVAWLILTKWFQRSGYHCHHLRGESGHNKLSGGCGVASTLVTRCHRSVLSVLDSKVTDRGEANAKWRLGDPACYTASS
jgi:hypothetical protein